MITRNLLQCKKCVENVTNVCGYNATRLLSSDPPPPIQQREKPLFEEMDEELRTAKPFEDIPKVPMVPILGSSWAYLPVIGRYNTKKIHEADLMKFQKYGVIVRERYGKFDLVSSYDPRVMKILNFYEGQYPARAEFSTLKEYRLRRKPWFKTLGLVVMQGADWSVFRKRLQNYVLNPVTLKAYLQPMHDVSRDLVECLSKKMDANREVDDVRLYLYKWALESICYVAMDKRLGCLDPNVPPDSDGMKIINAVQTMLTLMNRLENSAGNFPFWKFWPSLSPKWRKFENAADDFTLTTFQYIHDTIDKYISGKDPGPQTMLQQLILKEKLELSTAMVAVSDFIMAGIDTTSSAAGFLLYNLAKHPEKQQRAYEEIMSFLPNKDSPIDHRVHRDLHYVRACFQESMRIFPVVRGNLRILDRDVVVSGYRVPAGVPILCVLQISYRNEKYYKDPLEFRPERWGDGSIDRDAFYAPFGFGKRSCIGQHVAQQEIKSLVIEILRRYRMEYHHEDVELYSRFLNAPDKPLKIRFFER